MPLRVVTGFEFGSTAGWLVGNNGNRIVDGVTGTPAVITTTPRTGTYCLEIDTSGAAEAVAWDDNTLGGSQTRGRCAFGVRLNSLPGGDIVLAQWRSSALPGQFLYIQSSNQFGAIISGGTLQVGGPTLSANTWYHVELYYDCSAATLTIDWYIDGVAQTQASRADASGQIQDFQLGASTFSQTFAARYDDLIIHTDTSAIPSQLGRVKVQPLLVDTGGTVSTLGATSDFQTFSGATPTLTAWNATTARGNIDELPVNTGSAQDGIAQINTASTNAVEVPMTSYTLAAGETVAGLVIRVAGWQQDTTSGTIGVRSFNGTTETTLLAAQAHTNLANNSADPGWICRVATTADFDTQGEIDALTVRVGFSDDAAPDIGFGAIYGELAVFEAVAAVAVPSTPTQLPPYLLYELVARAQQRVALADNQPASENWQPYPLQLPYPLLLELIANAQAQVDVAPTGTPQTGTSSVGVTGSGTAVKVAAQTGRVSAGFTGASTPAKKTAEAGTAATGFTGTGVERKVQAEAGTAAVGLTGRGTEVKVQPDAGRVAVGVTGTGVERKVQPDAGTVSVGLTGRGTGISGFVIAETGRASVGLTGSGTGVKVAAQTGRCTVGLTGRGTQVKVSTPTASAAVGLTGRGVEVKKAGVVGSAALGATGGGSGRRIAVGITGRCTIGLTGTGLTSRRIADTGRVTVGVTGYGLPTTPSSAIPARGLPVQTSYTASVETPRTSTLTQRRRSGVDTP